MTLPLFISHNATEFFNFKFIIHQNLLRDCARETRIWQKAYQLPSIPDAKLQKFYELVRIQNNMQTVHNFFNKTLHCIPVRKKYFAFFHALHFFPVCYNCCFLALLEIEITSLASIFLAHYIFTYNSLSALY